MTDLRYEFAWQPTELVRLTVCEWLEQHGIDPREVAVPGWIELRPERRQIAYLAYVRKRGDDGEWHPVWDEDADCAERCESVLQLEARPMPFPLSPQERAL